MDWNSNRRLDNRWSLGEEGRKELQGNQQITNPELVLLWRNDEWYDDPHASRILIRTGFGQISTIAIKITSVCAVLSLSSRQWAVVHSVLYQNWIRGMLIKQRLPLAGDPTSCSTRPQKKHSFSQFYGIRSTPQLTSYATHAHICKCQFGRKGELSLRLDPFLPTDTSGLDSRSLSTDNSTYLKSMSDVELGLSRYHAKLARHTNTTTNLCAVKFAYFCYCQKHCQIVNVSKTKVEISFVLSNILDYGCCRTHNHAV